jgi:hypothetical protein
MDAKDLFLIQHAHLHTASVSGEHGPSLEDSLCDGLAPEQMCERPDGLNSIAWLLWHMTRFEDVVVNTVLRGRPEVLDGAWLARLGVDTRLVGTGSTDDEVASFSTTVDPIVVREYRAAVGLRTRRWAEREADWDALATVPDVAARLAAAPTALDDRAEWVRALWAKRTGLGLLALPVIGHSYIHIGEARVTRSRLGGRVP